MLSQLRDGLFFCHRNQLYEEGVTQDIVKHYAMLFYIHSCATPSSMIGLLLSMTYAHIGICVVISWRQMQISLCSIWRRIPAADATQFVSGPHVNFFTWPITRPHCILILYWLYHFVSHSFLRRNVALANHTNTIMATTDHWLFI